MVRKAAITLAVALSAVLAAAATVNKRIIGGEEAKEGEFPFIVRLHYEDPTTLCGGSLLDSTTVLTAHHCVWDLSVKAVRAGSLNKDTGGVVAEVESVRLMESREDSFNADVAILKLSTPIEESKTISYAKLPAEGSSPVSGSIAVAAGWGEQRDGTNIAVDKLRKVAVSIIDPADCKSGTQRPPKDRLDAWVCAGLIGVVGTGAGDSGGPLIDQETGQLIGITSGGSINIKFEKVSSWLPFIHGNDNGIGPSGVTG